MPFAFRRAGLRQTTPVPFAPLARRRAFRLRPVRGPRHRALEPNREALLHFALPNVAASAPSGVRLLRDWNSSPPIVADIAPEQALFPPALASLHQPPPLDP